MEIAAFVIAIIALLAGVGNGSRLAKLKEKNGMETDYVLV